MRNLIALFLFVEETRRSNEGAYPDQKQSHTENEQTGFILQRAAEQDFVHPRVLHRRVGFIESVFEKLFPQNQLQADDGGRFEEPAAEMQRISSARLQRRPLRAFRIDEEAAQAENGSGREFWLQGIR